MADQDRIVIGTIPAAGTVVPRGSAVGMLVHDGPIAVKPRPIAGLAVQQRRQRWIDVSTSANLMLLQEATWYFTTTIQQIGRLDCKLIEEDSRINALPDAEQRSPAETERGFDHMALGNLWVLGSFQILYTLDKTMKRKRIRFDGLQNRIDDVQGRFLRLRGPLAKRESKVGDYPFPFHAIRVLGSACWAVGPGTLISRIDLSDQFINLLAAIAVHPGPSQ